MNCFECFKKFIRNILVEKYTSDVRALNLLLPLQKNTEISPNFLVWKFCGKAQFSHSFGQFAQNYAETVPFHKISTPGN